MMRPSLVCCPFEVADNGFERGQPVRVCLGGAWMGGGKRATWLTAKIIILGRGGCCKIIVRIFKICLKKEEKRRSHTKYKSEITHPTSRQYISPADWWFFLESRSDVSFFLLFCFLWCLSRTHCHTLSYLSSNAENDLLHKGTFSRRLYLLNMVLPDTPHSINF